MTDRGRWDEESAGSGERYAGYVVQDRDGERIGTVDDLFLDELDGPEYIGVRKGAPGAGTAVIPFALLGVDDGRRLIEVAATRAHVENGPSFVDEQEVTPRFERDVRAHYGLERGSPDGYQETGERAESLRQPGSEPGDELRVQRSEEELRAGTRRREAGAVRIRKRVRTDRETVEVPKRREEVTVERAPASEGTAGASIGDEEVVVPVVEEEVVVEKRPVVKEEIRIRKDVVEDTRVVEDDVRREEIEIEDATERGRRRV